jgi:hypothetical protein
MNKKPIIYLAGPMSNCNNAQKKNWRNKIKEEFNDSFDFIDPTDDIIDKKMPNREVVIHDMSSINKSDGILANMWKESIGTTIGIMEALKIGKPVILSDPNFIRSKMLAFYFDLIESSPEEALILLGKLIQSRNRIIYVIKQNDELEAFDQRKILKSIRRACRKAEKDEIVLTSEIAPKVLNKLEPTIKKDDTYITSDEIKKCILETLTRLQLDNRIKDDIIAINTAWMNYEKKKSKTTSQDMLKLIDQVEKLKSKNDNLKINNEELNNYFNNIFENWTGNYIPPKKMNAKNKIVKNKFNEIKIGIIGGADQIKEKDIKNSIDFKFGATLIHNNGFSSKSISKLSNADIILVLTKKLDIPALNN